MSKPEELYILVGSDGWTTCVLGRYSMESALDFDTRLMKELGKRPMLAPVIIHSWRRNLGPRSPLWGPGHPHEGWVKEGEVEWSGGWKSGA